MPRMLENVAQARRPPRQAKPGQAPGRGGSTNGQGQPPFVPTDSQRVQVRRYIACGFTVDSIAVIMDIPHATLERHFQFELTNGKLVTDARILNGIVSMAEEGDKTMSIFWAKARAGWRDVRGPEGGAGDTTFTINIGHGSNGGVTIDHEPAAPTPTGGDVAGRISVTHRMRDPEEES